MSFSQKERENILKYLLHCGCHQRLLLGNYMSVFYKRNIALTKAGSMTPSINKSSILCHTHTQKLNLKYDELFCKINLYKTLPNFLSNMVLLIFNILIPVVCQSSYGCNPHFTLFSNMKITVK